MSNLNVKKVSSDFKCGFIIIELHSPDLIHILPCFYRIATWTTKVICITVNQLLCWQHHINFITTGNSKSVWQRFYGAKMLQFRLDTKISPVSNRFNLITHLLQNNKISLQKKLSTKFCDTRAFTLLSSIFVLKFRVLHHFAVVSVVSFLLFDFRFSGIWLLQFSSRFILS